MSQLRPVVALPASGNVPLDRVCVRVRLGRSSGGEGRLGNSTVPLQINHGLSRGRRRRRSEGREKEEEAADGDDGDARLLLPPLPLPLPLPAHALSLPASSSVVRVPPSLLPALLPPPSPRLVPVHLATVESQLQSLRGVLTGCGLGQVPSSTDRVVCSGGTIITSARARQRRSRGAGAAKGCAGQDCGGLEPLICRRGAGPAVVLNARKSCSILGPASSQRHRTPGHTHMPRRRGADIGDSRARTILAIDMERDTGSPVGCDRDRDTNTDTDTDANIDLVMAIHHPHLHRHHHHSLQAVSARR